MTESNSYEWNANDYSNIITIGASALASVLLVLFKSRCSKISLCWGLLSCDRKPQEEDEDKTNSDEENIIPNQNNQNDNDNDNIM